MTERIDELRRQLTEDPGSREFARLGEILLEQGEVDEGVRVLEAGLEHHPQHGAAWRLLGRGRLATGDLVGAEAAGAKALEIDTEDVEAARVIAEAASRREDWRRALSAWRLVLAGNPQDEAAVRRISEAEAGLNRPDEVSGPPGGAPVDAATEPESPAPLPETDTTPVPTEAVAEPDRPVMLPRDVFALEDEAPFEVPEPGDSGVWELGEDVFGAEMSHEMEEPPTGAVEGPPEPAEGGSAEPSGEPMAPEPVDVALNEQRAEVDVERTEEEPSPAEPAGPTEAEIAERSSGVEEGGEVPLATPTLVRLALSQGDLELARRTLDRIVEQGGPTEETAALAREIETASGATVGVEHKIERLQGWLERLRLAAERVDRRV